MITLLIVLVPALSVHISMITEDYTYLPWPSSFCFYFIVSTLCNIPF